MEMILTGEPIDAVTAEKWGLVSKVVPEDKLLEVRVEVFQSHNKTFITSHTITRSNIHTHTHILLDSSLF
jgi:enoyl-CoA hydratase/carnithine racemase